MARWTFEQGRLLINVRNPDDVQVTLEDRNSSSEGLVFTSFWELDAIVKKIRKEFAYQLDREELELVTQGAVKKL